MMKKMVVSDYDGTYYRNKDEIIKNIELTKEFQSKGNLFVVATGRSYESFIGEIDKFKLSFDYLILCSGALIMNRDLEILKTHIMNKKIIEQMIEETSHLTELIDRILYVNTYDRTENLEEATDILKFIIIMKDPMEARTLAKLYNEKYGHENNTYIVPTTKHTLVEVISNRTNKGQAIRDLKEIKSIRNFEVVTIGDSENDHEMVADFNGFAVNNAHPELLKVNPKMINSFEDLLERLK